MFRNLGLLNVAISDKRTSRTGMGGAVPNHWPALMNWQRIQIILRYYDKRSAARYTKCASPVLPTTTVTPVKLQLPTIDSATFRGVG